MAGVVNIDDIELVRRDRVMKAGPKKGFIRFFESAGFSDAVVDVEIDRTLEGASTVTVTAVDPDGSISDLEEFQSQASLYPAEVRIGKRWYSMAGMSKGDDGILSITFEDREVNTLRRYRRPRKSKRARQTRAEFCRSLVAEASIVTDRDGPNGRIVFVSPESETHQIIGLDGQTVADALASDSGFPAGIRLKYLRRTFITLNAAPGGNPPRIKWKNEIRIANKTQLNHYDRVFKECLKQRAPKSVYEAAALLALSGSNLWNTNDQPGRPGNLFGLPIRGVWRVSPGTDAQLHLRKLIPVVVRELKKRSKSHPKWGGSRLASAVSGRSEQTMKPWWPYAQLAVREWKGGANRTTDAYEFTRGEPNGSAGESTWEAITRMAGEVGWRCWCDEGRVYFVSEDYLINRPSALSISTSVDGINGISWSQEGGEIPSECSVSVMADAFAVDPGACVTVFGEGAANGRWLVKSVTQSVFSDEAEVTLSRAQPRLAEPKGDIGALAVNPGSAKINTAPAAVLAMIKKANEIDGNAYSQANRTGPSYDCSSAVSALLMAGGFIPQGAWMSTVGGPMGVTAGGTNMIGVPGRGKYFTIHSSGGAGNAGHTWIVFEKASGLKGAPKMFEFGGRSGGRNGWKSSVRRDRPARHIKGF